MATDEVETERLAPSHPEDKEDKKAGGRIPPPMVREAMGFGGFAQAHLVAGQGGLDRRIEWVRVMETSESSADTRPNELLLVTEFPDEGDPAGPLQILQSLSASGGSA